MDTNSLIVLAIVATFVVISIRNWINRRLNMLDRRLLQILHHLEIDPDEKPSPSERVRQLAVDPKQRIEAIKVYREESGLELRDAKDVIDELGGVSK